MLLVVIIFKCSIFSHSLCYLSAWQKAWFLQGVSSLKTVLLCISATASFPPTTLTVTSTSHQPSLYILILKLNSQWHSCKFSCLAPLCRQPLLGHDSNRRICLLELTKILKFSFFSFFFYFILSVLNKVYVSAMQVVQLCTLLCSLTKLASGSSCWFLIKCSQIPSFVGVLGGLFNFFTGSGWAFQRLLFF